MRIFLKNAWVLDANNEFTLKNVMVEGGIIASVMGDETSEADKIIDLEGHTLMPGFIDAHIHIATNDSGFSNAALKAWVKNGVTTVRDMGMLCGLDYEQYMKWLRSCEGPQYPRILTAGKFIDIKGGYGEGPDPVFGFGIIIDTPEQAADAVSYQFENGNDGIKIGLSEKGGSGGVRPKMSGDFITAIAERAHHHGLWLSAHHKDVEDFELLMRCGMDNAAHTPSDMEMPEELIMEAIEKNITFITTIGESNALPHGMPEHMLEQVKTRHKYTLKNLKAIHAAGGTIAVGTDLIHSDDFMRDAAIPVGEMRQLAGIGMSLTEVIRAATLNSAIVCRTDGEEGSIEQGKRANLVAVRGRPDMTFELLKSPCFVMNRGQIIREEL